MTTKKSINGIDSVVESTNVTKEKRPDFQCIFSQLPYPNECYIGTRLIPCEGWEEDRMKCPYWRNKYE